MKQITFSDAKYAGSASKAVKLRYPLYRDRAKGGAQLYVTRKMPDKTCCLCLPVYANNIDVSQMTTFVQVVGRTHGK